MKRILLIVGAVAVVGAIAYGAWLYMGGTSSASDGLGGTGTIEAADVTVSSQMSGRIVSATVKEGDVVKKGSVLFALDDTMAKVQIQQAQAGVNAAAATLRFAKDDGKSDAEIAQDQAQLDQAKAALKMAQIQAGYARVVAPMDGVALTVAGGGRRERQPGRHAGDPGRYEASDRLHLRAGVAHRSGEGGSEGDADHGLVRQDVRVQGHLGGLSGRVHARLHRDEGPAGQARVPGAAGRVRSQWDAQARHAGGREALA